MQICNRSDIIRALIEKHSYSRYLEIGVRDNKNFNRINVKEKDGVDPAGKCNYKMTSDKFFQQISKDKIYDIVFIDGLHLKDQVLRDVNNSLAHLSDNGVLVLHDCSPIKASHATPNYNGGTWNGTVWEAFAELRMTRSDLFMCVVNVDTGCGIIKRAKYKKSLFPKNKITFNLLEEHRQDLLNLKTKDEFVKMLNTGRV